MSTTGTLPPQAYTREVLVKAYEWLSAQTPIVRERAKTADSMVALYLQAKRRNGVEGSALEAPTAASVEAFKADLRNLAEGLRQFEDPHFPPPLESTAAVAPAQPSFQPQQTTHVPPLRSPVYTPPPPAMPFNDLPPMAATLMREEPVPEKPAKVQFTVDAKTQGWIREVQIRLNLSSEADATRALIAIGYERLRDLLPRP